MMKVTAPTPARQDQPGSIGRSSFFLVVARAGWIAIAGLSVLLQVVALPVRYAQLGNPPTPVQAGLLSLGLPLQVYVFYNLILDSCLVLGFCIAAALLFWRKSDEWFPLLIAFFLVIFGTTGPVFVTLEVANPAWYPLVELMDLLGWGLLGFFLSLFPDGRFVPRWTRWYSFLYLLLGLLWVVPPNSPFHPANWPPILFVPLQFGSAVLFLGAQVYRYWRVSGPIERQQTKWLIFGLVVVLCTLPFLTLSITPERTPPTVFGLFVIPALRLLWLFLPFSLYMAIMRYRLWDIDLIINRTLVYGVLTACIVALYVLTVVGLGTLLQVQGTPGVSLFATGLVAVLFQPLRLFLQRSINRLMYGERDDPYRVLSRLGQRLEATLVPDAVLPTVVETVAQALKLPYVAVMLQREDILMTTASYGRLSGEPLTLPLIYQRETIGQLQLAPRAPGEAFSPSDMHLLRELASQVGLAAHAVRLTSELQRSNEHLSIARVRLVTTREEERRRLRRDLHDGLGPTLAALTLKIGAARKLLPYDQSAVDRLLLELNGDIETTVGDIRRLVYNLRPPSLDELGLVGAIRERVAQSILTCDTGDVDGLQVTVDAPEHLPLLAAAVEVAAYRIVQEALTNVVRHSSAHTCRICLSLQETLFLRIEVRDDGIGWTAEQRPGVGIHSMYERATELGGTCFVEPIVTGGTRVVACLPLSDE